MPHEGDLVRIVLAWAAMMIQPSSPSNLLGSRDRPGTLLVIYTHVLAGKLEEERCGERVSRVVHNTKGIIKGYHFFLIACKANL